ncbi:hypothetical protein L6Q96_00470 [Candidatus Binatia bacterium]|nr:hypothetical protein [Candidatus Binatia bacterium]
MTIPPLPPDDRIRALAADVLGREEYARWRAAPVRGFFDLLIAIERWLDIVRAWLAVVADTQPVLYSALLVALLLVGVGLLVHIAYAVHRALGAASRGVRPMAEETAPPAWLNEAEGLARAGRSLEAAHRVHLAVLTLLLEERGLRLDRAEPNRVLRRRLTAARLGDAERRELLRLLDRLETRWFRDRADDPGLYEAWRTLYARVAALT